MDLVHGFFQGIPTEEKCIEHVYAAFKYLTTDGKLKPHEIVLVGQSLGTGPTCHLAATLSGDGTPAAVSLFLVRNIFKCRILCQ